MRRRAASEILVQLQGKRERERLARCEALAGHVAAVVNAGGFRRKGNP